MAVTVRGGAASPPKPRSKASARAPARGGGSPKGAGPARPIQPARGGYAPGKLGAVRGVGLPPQIALGVALIAVLIALAGALIAEHRGKALAFGAGATIDRAFALVGLKVKSLTVQGATPAAQADIIKAAQIYQDQPLLGVDLAAVRARVEQVGWVKQARVVRLFPDTIIIAVTQRPTLAVWQHAGHTQVIDTDGHAIPEADPNQFAQLPLVVGEGANDNAEAILSLVRARPRLTQKLDALVRVDNRRWDLRMSDGGLIQLPPTGEDSALIQLDQLDQKSRILELGFARIDLRDPDMVTVRPKDAAPPGLPVAGGA